MELTQEECYTQAAGTGETGSGGSVGMDRQNGSHIRPGQSAVLSVEAGSLSDTLSRRQ